MMSPHVSPQHGQTPLMLAAQGNHVAVCAQLLRRGAKPGLADRDGRWVTGDIGDTEDSPGSVAYPGVSLLQGRAGGHLCHCVTVPSRHCPHVPPLAIVHCSLVSPCPSVSPPSPAQDGAGAGAGSRQPGGGRAAAGPPEGQGHWECHWKGPELGSPEGPKLREER